MKKLLECAYFCSKKTPMPPEILSRMQYYSVKFFYFYVLFLSNTFYTFTEKISLNMLKQGFRKCFSRKFLKFLSEINFFTKINNYIILGTKQGTFISVKFREIISSRKVLLNCLRLDYTKLQSAAAAKYMILNKTNIIIFIFSLYYLKL